MIEITNLKKTFGQKIAVDISNLIINDNDILGLVGNNGAGKSTLFRLLLGLHKPDSQQTTFTEKQDASIHIQFGSGNDLWECSPWNSELWKNYTCAYLDEGFLIDFLTPEEYFDFIGKCNDKTIDIILGNKELSDLFSAFMNNEILGQKKLIRDFSAGNKQKIGIIGSILGWPKILILDEPFNFLDPSSQNILKKILKLYHEETMSTILISSHNLQHTIEISNRVVLLENGRVIKDLKNDHGSAELELEKYFKV